MSGYKKASQPLKNVGLISAKYVELGNKAPFNGTKGHIKIVLLRII